MPESPERTALYRYFDRKGVLLYVGISNDPDFRSKAHLYERRPGGWPRLAASRTDEWHASRELALAAEKVAIRAERPLHNSTHNYDDVEFEPASWPTVGYGRKADKIADLIRKEIEAGRWRPGQRLPSIRRLTEATRVSQPLISRASTLLQREGILVFEPGRGLFVALPGAQSKGSGRSADPASGESQ